MRSTRYLSGSYNPLNHMRFGGWTVLTPTARRGSQSRFFSSHSATHHAAWTNSDASLPRVTHYLRDPEITLPTDTTFSIINPNYVTRQLEDLRAIYTAIGTEEHTHPMFRYPNKLVVLTPERTATHMIAATVATEIKWEDEREFHAICDKLEKPILDAIREKRKFFRGLSQECEQLSHQWLHQIADIYTDDQNSDLKRLLLIQNAVMQRVKQGLVDPNQSSRMIQAIFMDDLLRAQYKSEVQNMVTEAIKNQLQLQFLTSLDYYEEEDREKILLLPQVSHDKRFTKFLAGGIATGKSSLAKQFFTDLQVQHGLRLGDFAKISTDIFRERLKQSMNIGSDYKIQSSLLHDESRLITDLSFELLQSKLETQGYAPHVFMEAISPTDHELHLATHRGGSVRVAITHFPDPADAVHGNYKRSQDQKKYAPPCDAVLNSQSFSTKATSSIVKKHAGKNIVMTLHNTYKIIHESSQSSELIAAFLCEQNKMMILDVAEMLNYFKKSHINTKATCPNTVYTDHNKTSLSSLAEHFKQDYGHLSIQFIAPNVHEKDIAQYEKHAYATYNPDSGFTIHNVDQFCQLVMHNPAAQELFQALGADLSILNTHHYSCRH